MYPRGFIEPDELQELEELTADKTLPKSVRDALAKSFTAWKRAQELRSHSYAQIRATQAHRKSLEDALEEKLAGLLERQTLREVPLDILAELGEALAAEENAPLALELTGKPCDILRERIWDPVRSWGRDGAVWAARAAVAAGPADIAAEATLPRYVERVWRLTRRPVLVPYELLDMGRLPQLKRDRAQHAQLRTVGRVGLYFSGSVLRTDEREAVETWTASTAADRFAVYAVALEKFTQDSSGRWVITAEARDAAALETEARELYAAQREPVPTA